MKRKFAWITAITLVVFALGACTAASTDGVKVVGDNVVQIQPGETAGFYKNVGKTWYNLEITYEEQADSMHLECTPFCPDSMTKLGAVGESIKFDSGIILSGSFTATKQADGSVHLHWPFAINFVSP